MWLKWRARYTLPAMAGEGTYITETRDEADDDLVAGWHWEDLDDYARLNESTEDHTKRRVRGLETVHHRRWPNFHSIDHEVVERPPDCVVQGKLIKAQDLSKMFTERVAKLQALLTPPRTISTKTRWDHLVEDDG